MSDRLLVGITGYLGVGKTTLARMLASRLNAMVTPLAAPLKWEANTMLFQYTGTYADAAEIARLKGSVFGPLYQAYGEYIRRTKGEDYWLARLKAVIPSRAIIDDVRYPNEARWVQSSGGVLIGLEGPCRRPGDSRDPDHPSEAGIQECLGMTDIHEFNIGTLDDLARVADRLVSQHFLVDKESAS